MAVTIKAVQRTFRLIEALAEDAEGKGILQLAKDTGLPASTVHRMLHTLSDVGYITQARSNDQYRLTTKLLEVASRAVVGPGLKAVAAARLPQLRDATRESTHLAVLEGRQVVTIDSYLSLERNLVDCHVGEQLSLHSSSVGKVLLAHLPSAKLDSLLDQLELKRYTPHTLCTRAEVRAELDRVQSQGYALDLDEVEIGIRCIAAPVRDGSGAVVAAVGISGPSTRLTDERLKGLIEQVVAAARDISLALGAPQEQLLVPAHPA